MEQLNSLIKYEQTLIQLTRVFNTRSMILFYALGRTMSETFFLDTYFLFAYLIFISTYAYASITNFELDEKADEINRKSNPYIGSKQMRLQTKKFQMVVLAVALGLPIIDSSFVSTIVSFILLALGFLYSHPKILLSYHPIGKFVSMALTYTIVPGLYGFFHLPGATLVNILPLFAICLFYSSWMLFSDIKDMEGDRKVGKRTLVVLLGVRGAVILSFLLSIVSFFLYNLYQPESRWVAFIMLLFTSVQFVFIVSPDLLMQKKLRQIGSYALLFFLFCTVLSFT